MLSFFLFKGELFSNDPHFDFSINVSMHFNANTIDAKRFDRFLDLDLSFIDLKSFFFQSISNHLGSNGSKDLIFFANLDRYRNGYFFKLGGKIFSSCNFMLFLFEESLFFFFERFDIAFKCNVGNFSWDKKISCETFFNFNQIADLS